MTRSTPPTNPLTYDARENTKPVPPHPQSPYDQGLILRMPEAAQVLLIELLKLRALNGSQRIPHIKIDGCIVFRLADLKQLIDENLIGGDK